VAAAASSAPTAFALRRVSGVSAWPVVIEVSLPTLAPAQLVLYDVAGRACVRQALNWPAPGAHRLELNAPPAPGVYWLTLEQAGHRKTLKMIVLQ
jgi:hypothetical protein